MEESAGRKESFAEERPDASVEEEEKQPGVFDPPPAYEPPLAGDEKHSLYRVSSSDGGRRRSKVELVSLSHGLGRPRCSSEELIPSVAALVRCFGEAEVASTVRLWIEDRYPLREILAEVFERLCVRRQVGLRGVLLCSLAYEALIGEVVRSVRADEVDLVDTLVDEIREHCEWLSRQDTDVLLRLSLTASAELPEATTRIKPPSFSAEKKIPTSEATTTTKRENFGRRRQSSGGSSTTFWKNSRAVQFYASQSKELMEKLVSTRIFRTMVHAKYMEGPIYMVRLEMILYAIIMVCYSMSIPIQRNAAFFGARGRANVFQHYAFSWFLLVLAAPCVGFFSIRMQFQLQFLAQFEQCVHSEKKQERKREERDLFGGGDIGTPVHHRKRIKQIRRSLRVLGNVIGWCIYRACAVVVVIVYGPFVFGALALLPQRSRPGQKTLGSYGRVVVDWFRREPEVHPRGSLVIIPRSWRSDPLNWVEALFIAICWLWLILSLRFCLLRTYDRHRPKYDAVSADILNFGTLLMWIRTLGFLRESRTLAPFVILLTKTVFHDLKVFFVILLVLFFGFTHTLYNSIILSREFADNKRPGDGNNGGTSRIGILMEAVYTYILTGETAGDASLDTIDRLYVILITFIMLVVVLNVLVALIIESYEAAMTKASQLFWYSRFEQVAKTIGLFGDLVGKALPSDAIEATLHEELADAAHEALFGHHISSTSRRKDRH